MLVYNIPEGSGARDLVVAQGEPVREGQKVLTVSSLKRMAVRTRVHEGEINKVRSGQKVEVRVDAFPGRILTGKVDFVATVANQGFSQDVRLYEVVITIDGEQKGDLKPGMSGEIAIVVAERANCLRVPSSAILGKGKDAFCYILTEKELHVRKVTVGISDGKLTEIQDGLKEGESVLRNPRAVVERLK
jgi:RND family efflux transporter MFP subunit